VRLGHEVALVRHGEDLSELAASLHADVVVLDGGDSLAEVTAAVAAVKRRAPNASVIVVADAGAEDYHFRVVPKWSRLDRLSLEIAREGAGVASPAVPPS
jgi:DNA-binding NtrC family response regulator